ncbi:hypothetical protein [Kribbella sindirgiensis]|uniref:Uncharacterized protein n=1 Tax=Kribbella sindirgiensis TaxID=1124744 RepID=A0A4R0ISG4_9ACTN|nr:hypothetical protein [Kribbella sindirgiensis]TCC36783.1 hypothetical protein E0H50_08775 [Kribbella sindirgiensis]
MSNQQGGYPGQQPPQQPPYGQQQYGPQYGQQYVGYPPPPPPPRKVGPIVVAIVGALMLIGAGVFVVTRFTGGSDDAADGTTQPVAPSTKPTLRPASEAPTQQPTTGGSPTTGESPAKPTAQPATQPPAQPTKLPAGCNGCLPGATVSSLVTAFKSKGYVCKLDRRWECNKGTVDVYISPDYSKKKYPESIDVSGSGSAKVQNCPQCVKAAVASLKQGLPGALAIFVPDASIRQQIVTFALQGAGIPASGPSSARDAKVGAYRLSTQGYSGATVGKNGKYATFYSTSVSISGISEY